ncbi:MAG: hypothetical protein J7L14_02890 [Candidatus Diapherotrites archaeon]|nr:hypothetical protein [Candidatus Diapherotrites archaeon]
MKEIKFRAFDTKNKVMMDWEDIKYIDLNTLQRSNILMGYIGLKDKKGKEIYDGDIVHVEAVAYGRNMNAVVIWKNGGFILKWEDEYESYIQDWAKELAESEVIGNIYENPELLR